MLHRNVEQKVHGGHPSVSFVAFVLNITGCHRVSQFQACRGLEEIRGSADTTKWLNLLGYSVWRGSIIIIFPDANLSLLYPISPCQFLRSSITAHNRHMLRKDVLIILFRRVEPKVTHELEIRGARTITGGNKIRW